MRIATGYRSTDEQLRLFETPIGNHGAVRYALGDFVEDLTAKFLHGRRIVTDSTVDYCPDIVAGTRYYECKCVGRTRETMVYTGRLEKDALFAEHHELYYAIWHHRANTLAAQTKEDLRRLFLCSLQFLMILPFESFHSVALSVPVTPLNSQYGKSHKDPVYGEGRRIALTKLMQVPHLLIPFEYDDEQD